MLPLPAMGALGQSPDPQDHIIAYTELGSMMPK